MIKGDKTVHTEEICKGKYIFMALYIQVSQHMHRLFENSRKCCCFAINKTNMTGRWYLAKWDPILKSILRGVGEFSRYCSAPDTPKTTVCVSLSNLLYLPVMNWWPVQAASLVQSLLKIEAKPSETLLA